MSSGDGSCRGHDWIFFGEKDVFKVLMIRDTDHPASLIINAVATRPINTELFTSGETKEQSNDVSLIPFLIQSKK